MYALARRRPHRESKPKTLPGGGQETSLHSLVWALCCVLWERKHISKFLNNIFKSLLVTGWELRSGCRNDSVICSSHRWRLQLGRVGGREVDERLPTIFLRDFLVLNDSVAALLGKRPYSPTSQKPMRNSGKQKPGRRPGCLTPFTSLVPGFIQIIM